MFNLTSLLNKIQLTKTAEENPFLEALSNHPDYTGKLDQFRRSQGPAAPRVQAQEFPPVRDGYYDIASDTVSDLAGEIGGAAKAKLVGMRDKYVDKPMQKFFNDEFGEQFVSPRSKEVTRANIDTLNKAQMDRLGEIVRGPQHDAADLIDGGEIKNDFTSRYLEPLVTTQKYRRDADMENIGQQIYMGAPMETINASLSQILDSQRQRSAYADSAISGVSAVNNDNIDEEKRRKILERLRSLLK